METYEVKVTQHAGIIACDFEAAKAYLQEQLAIYKRMVFTEDTKKSAKEMVAELRKQKKAFSDRVSEVKREHMIPFEQFSRQAQELYLLYDEPIGFINAQIEDFEKKRVEEKKGLIREWYEELIADMADILPFDRIYNSKWENATTSQKAIRGEMMERKEAAKQAIATIKGMNSDVEDMALAMYRETYDIQRCILFITNHEKQKQEILAKEQERIRREERERLEAERKAEEDLQRVREQAEAEKQEAVSAALEKGAQAAIDSLIPDQEGEENLYEYRVSLTADAKKKLELYMDSVGIEWEMI